MHGRLNDRHCIEASAVRFDAGGHQRFPDRCDGGEALRRERLPARHSGLPLGIAGRRFPRTASLHLNTFGAKDGDVVLYVSLKDKARMLTPNLTTIYG